MADILYIGTALIDSIVKDFDPIPVSASGYRAASGSLHAGGEAVNGSIAASKLGLNSAILCFLGWDDAGDLVARTLDKNGVDTGAIVRLSDHQTPVTTMLVEADGSRKSVTNRAHAFNFRPDHYPELLKGHKSIMLGSLFRAPFDDPEIIFRVIDTAKQDGAVIFADTKIPNFKTLTLKDVAVALPLVDYIFPNEDEAAYFTGEEDADKMADVFLDYGVKNVVLKLGAKGCLFKNDHEKISIGAYSVQAVDSTGAGDNFGAGFAAELLAGKNHETALRFATACGAISTTKQGALDGLKNRKQAERFLQSGGKELL